MKATRSRRTDSSRSVGAEGTVTVGVGEELLQSCFEPGDTSRAERPLEALLQRVDDVERITEQRPAPMLDVRRSRMWSGRTTTLRVELMTDELYCS